jgi:hypothetical protein
VTLECVWIGFESAPRDVKLEQYTTRTGFYSKNTVLDGVPMFSRFVCGTVCWMIAKMADDEPRRVSSLAVLLQAIGSLHLPHSEPRVVLVEPRGTFDPGKTVPDAILKNLGFENFIVFLSRYSGSSTRRPGQVNRFVFALLVARTRQRGLRHAQQPNHGTRG